MKLTTNDKQEIQKRVEKICGWLEVPLPTRPQTIGRLGELLAYLHFKLRGVKITYGCLFSHKEPYDFKVKNKRLEVKTSLAQNGVYTFTLAKNRKEEVYNFDYVMLIFLETIQAEPNIIFVPAKNLNGILGFSGTYGQLNKRFYRNWRNCIWKQ